ncbi:aldo-keto reductase family 1 member C3-like isoform X2 [Sciurus carolinensis]|uniref:aldo-keto reductase family 1 member C3-like isoform X2 n=1 Tax=Sciurus carolinensis TaxID=30640 RepID=UPI001FB3213C|nr:aldo-keto reductase family 1 member C3-like isoform X2 [Sciurus carolinensis]
MNSKHQYVELNDGHFIPRLGFGTYKLQEVPNSKTTEATEIAIEAGYHHIDCAYVYQVEEEVGLAIRRKIIDGTVKREDIFYTSKLWSTFHRPELVQSCLERSLRKLHFDYVDLYLIHLPISMKAMEKCKDAGLAKSIGVSNFNRRQLEMILNKPGLRYKPVCNQVECHVYHNQRKLLDFCKSKDIVLVAFGALGTQREKRWVDPSSPVLLDDPVLGTLAKKHKRSPALIALRYQLQRGVVVLAQSLKESEIKENIQVFDFQLTDEDMIELDGLNRNFRYLLIKSMVNHPNYPFADEY